MRQSRGCSTTTVQNRCKLSEGCAQHQSLSLTKIPEISKLLCAACTGSCRLHDTVLKHLQALQCITSISSLCSWSSAEFPEHRAKCSPNNPVFLPYTASSLILTRILRLLLHRSLSHLNKNQILSFQKDMLSLSLGLAPNSAELEWNINSDLD